MNAKDLMLGDWVYGLYPDGTKYKRPFLITAVDTYPVNKSPRIVTNGGYGFQEEYLAPIPLTPEILEENFEKKTFYGIYDDYFDLDIREYSDGLYIVTYHSCEFNIPDQAIHLSWVHELQHFMRHCGIEKEITL